MTFEKQVQKAKEEKLKYRIIRDILFIILGITFLTISIFMSFKEKEENTKNNNETKKISQIQKSK